MKQFSEVSSLINKSGYRFSRGNFRFKIEGEIIILFFIFKVDYGESDEDAMKEVANTIRSCLNEYYKDWNCEATSDSVEITNV